MRLFRSRTVVGFAGGAGQPKRPELLVLRPFVVRLPVELSRATLWLRC